MNYLKLFSFLILFTFSASAQDADLTLENIFSDDKLNTKTVSGLRSMNDGNHYTILSENKQNGTADIVLFSYKTGIAIDTILKSKDITKDSADNFIIEDYEFSADEKQILITTQSEPIYRHSVIAYYFIWDRVEKKLTKIDEGKKQMHATFSPDGKKIAFVRENNLYFKNLESNTIHQITNDGAHNSIINGASDWVYEEEFALVKAFEWSPDSKKIAFYKFNESQVKEFSMDYYDGLYPSTYKFKYPKAGEQNSVVNIHCFNTETNELIKFDTGLEPDQYIPRIKWTCDPAMLSIQRMNRYQNKLELLFGNASTGKTAVVLTEENKYYIDIHDNLTFLMDKKHFTWTSEKSGYNHIYLYDISGKLKTQITSGNWDVTEFKGVDEKRKLVYFISAEKSPLNSNLYVIGLDGKGKKMVGNSTGENDATFSSGYNYFIQSHSNSSTPTITTLYKYDGKQIRVLEDNKNLIETTKEINFIPKEFFQFETSEKVKLNGWMIKPKNFDTRKKYPLLMIVYGGPGSQTVQDAWERQSEWWYQYFSQHGYIVASVDNRGTGARGEEFKKMTYMQLGKYETDDQIEAAKYLGSLGYIDAARIGIYGWSYGGYMVSLCMTKGADFFKLGVAGAPVTSWRYYDTIYTERYMRTPQENPSGYDDNSPINHADKLKGKYLLIHGMADDNVHLQNSTEWIKALIEAGRDFDSEFYPDKNHHVSGGNSKLHLHKKISHFILENL